MNHSGCYNLSIPDILIVITMNGEYKNGNRDDYYGTTNEWNNSSRECDND